MGKEHLQAETAEWVRFYQPTDPDVYHQIYRKKPNQKLLAAHQFTLDRIVQCTGQVQALAAEMRVFGKDAVLLPIRVPQPAF